MAGGVPAGSVTILMVHTVRVRSVHTVRTVHTVPYKKKCVAASQVAKEK